MKRVLFALLVAGCAGEKAPPPPRTPADVQRVSGREIDLSLGDVLGRPVRLGGQAPVAVVVFISRESKEESSELLRRLDERLLNAPIETVGIVDLRRYGSGLMRKIATRKLKQSAEDSRNRRRERREAKGSDASPANVDRFHLVGDFDGSIYSKFGVEEEPDHPVAYVVQRSGAVQGPYRDADSLAAAVGQALAERGASKSARNQPKDSSRRAAHR
jgi:hypothetical protein